MNEHKKEEGATSFRVKQAVQLYHASIPIPDHEWAWEKMRGKIKADVRRRRVSRSLKIGAAVVCFSFVVSIMTGTIQQTSAYANLYTLVKKVQNGLVTMIFSDTSEKDRSGARTPPPPERDSQQASSSPNETMALNGAFKPVILQEAREKAAFDFRIPEYAAEGYGLNEVGIMEVGEGVYPVVRLTYEAEGQKAYIITQRLVAPDELNRETIIRLIDETASKVDVGGRKGVLIHREDGGLRLQWLDDQVVTAISGELSEDEMLKVAQSMNKIAVSSP